MSIEIEIMFDDLSAERQQLIIDALGADVVKERNWDVFPIAVIDLEEEP